MKGKNIIIIILSLLCLLLCGYFIYNKTNKVGCDCNDISTNCINDVSSDNGEYSSEDRDKYIVMVKSDIVGKYVNKINNNEYIQLNSDGIATIKFETGGGPAQVNDKMRYDLISFDKNNQYLLLQLSQPYAEKGPNPICLLYIVKKLNGKYVLDVTTPTPASTPGSYDFIKE